MYTKAQCNKHMTTFMAVPTEYFIWRELSKKHGHLVTIYRTVMFLTRITSGKAEVEQLAKQNLDYDYKAYVPIYMVYY